VGLYGFSLKFNVVVDNEHDCIVVNVVVVTYAFVSVAEKSVQRVSEL